MPKYFSLSEFACPCCGLAQADELLLSLLDTARHIIGRPLIVSSGFRCAVHNASVGGVANSQHIHGRAADVYADGITVDELALIFRELHAGGVGRYYQQGFVHVDARPQYPPAEWDDMA